MACNDCDRFYDCDNTGAYEPSKKTTPCDYPDSDGHFHCPFAYDDDSYVSCRDFCGLGVDE